MIRRSGQTAAGPTNSKFAKDSPFRSRKQAMETAVMSSWMPRGTTKSIMPTMVNYL